MQIELDFCILKFTKNYIICTVHENAHVTEDKAMQISEQIINYYEEDSFIYITHRLNNYTVVPSVYQIVSKIKTLMGIIVVSDEKSTIKKSITEKKLLVSQPFFEIFNDIEDAIFWANSISSEKANN